VSCSFNSDVFSAGEVGKASTTIKIASILCSQCFDQDFIESTEGTHFCAGKYVEM
jgi:hypothetical protein